MATVHIDASEVHELADDMRRHADEAEGQAGLVIQRTGYDTEAIAKINAPVDTGNLKNSISTDFTPLGFDCGPTASYGGWVELGVPHPYVIRARPGHSLHFVVGGEDVFVKSVTHPATPPNPYLGPAADLTFEQAYDAFGDLVAQAVSR